MCICGSYRIHEYLEAGGVEDTKWNYGAGCGPKRRFEDLNAKDPLNVRWSY